MFIEIVAALLYFFVFIIGSSAIGISATKIAPTPSNGALYAEKNRRRGRITIFGLIDITQI